MGPLNYDKPADSCLFVHPKANLNQQKHTTQNVVSS